MSNRIYYDARTPHGKLLAEAVDGVIEATAKVQRLKRALDSMAEPALPSPSWGQIETELGLAAGTGESLHALVADAEQKLTAANVRQFTDRLDQG